ncbi:MAG TPA: hypothetical protein VFT51_02735, partial [Bacillales bacterium]|nr:hypothetical protein [Bacillales bacterium]
MAVYLHSTIFSYYCSGIYEGKIQFKEKNVMHARVDRRQRTQMQEDVLADDLNANLPFMKIYENLEDYADADWSGDEVRLENGDLYKKHIQYEGKVDGEAITSQVWALRNETAVDVVTVAGEIIAFLCPNRNGMEVVVKEECEKLTPLV